VGRIGWLTKYLQINIYITVITTTASVVGVAAATTTATNTFDFCLTGQFF